MQVFPALRRSLRERFVELVDVDLRWGITEEDVERGEVLPICLAEIDKARSYFIGLLGERYGWVPRSDQYPPELVPQWLGDHVGGKSVTELEILHGVLNEPAMAGRARLDSATIDPCAGSSVSFPIVPLRARAILLALMLMFVRALLSGGGAR